MREIAVETGCLYVVAVDSWQRIRPAAGADEHSRRDRTTQLGPSDAGRGEMPPARGSAMGTYGVDCEHRISLLPPESSRDGVLTD